MGISYFLVQTCMHITKVSCFSVDFPFALAPSGFVKLCEASGGIGGLSEALGGFGRLRRLCKARLWEALFGSLERLLNALGGFVT